MVNWEKNGYKLIGILLTENKIRYYVKYKYFFCLSDNNNMTK